MGRSDNGWMTTDFFYGWVANHFVRWIPAECPVVLLVDGHGSHIDVEVSGTYVLFTSSLYSPPPTL